MRHVCGEVAWFFAGGRRLFGERRHRWNQAESNLWNGPDDLRVPGRVVESLAKLHHALGQRIICYAVALPNGFEQLIARNHFAICGGKDFEDRHGPGMDMNDFLTALDAIVARPDRPLSQAKIGAHY